MTAPKWQAGKLYVPGDIVQPVQKAPVVATALPNAGFEDGDTGWSKIGNFTILNDPAGAYSGDWFARFEYDGGAGGAVATTARFPVTPGQSITASCMIIAFGAADQTGGDVNIVWLNSSGGVISTSQGNEVNVTQGVAWRKSSVTGIAPAGAAEAYVQADVFALQAGGMVGVDSFVWGYTAPASTAGLVYKAVQPDAGTSGASEPEWPTTNGVQVTDNEVIWEAIQTSRVVWEASHILKSGGTEPDWPDQVGGFVRDGTINWEAISRRVEDENCPNSKVVAIVASKVYAGDDDIVAFSATVNPLDWSSEQDAGYLPTGLQQYGANPVAAMGLYRSNLVVFNSAAFQMWQVDEDPANSALLDALPIGSTHHKALAPVSNDLFFLADQGVRTVGIAGGSTNLAAGDVGMPIDPLVQEALRVAAANSITPRSTYVPSMGQYWLAFSGYPADALAITGDVPDGYVGDAGTYQYGATGGVLPYGDFTITAGELPPGATMDDNGLVTYAYTTTGSYSWTVQVTDADGNVAILEDSADVLEYWSSVDRTATADAEMVLSNLSRDATGTDIAATGTYNVGVRGVAGHSSGRRYVEIEILANDATNSAFYGVGTVTRSLGDLGKVGTVGHSGNDNYNIDGTNTIETGNAASGDRIGIAIDFDIQRAWISRNGVWMASQSPATTNGLLNTAIPAGELRPIFIANASASFPNEAARLHLKADTMLHFPDGAWDAFTAWGEA